MGEQSSEKAELCKNCVSNPRMFSSVQKGPGVPKSFAKKRGTLTVILKPHFNVLLGPGFSKLSFKVFG